MKGGLVVLLAALQAFEQTPGASALGWEILLTPDEETGSHGSAPLFVEAAARHTFALVFEPARPSGDIVQSRKGTGSFTATCRGRAAHAAQVPSPGRNAILALAEFLLAAAKIPAELPGVLVNVGNIRGGSAATNVVPDFAQSELDVRITRVADREPLLARLHALAAVINARDGFRLELTGSFNRPPKECGPAEESAFAAWQQAGVTHAISIERCGQAFDGRPRNLRGVDIGDFTAPLDELFLGGPWAKLAVGDGGNEIGMHLRDKLRRLNQRQSRPFRLAKWRTNPLQLSPGAAIENGHCAHPLISLPRIARARRLHGLGQQ
jgi:acetylornithine deacetylase/succinyl-diaminopimelate desuccinylase-like protein